MVELLEPLWQGFGGKKYYLSVAKVEIFCDGLCGEPEGLGLANQAKRVALFSSLICVKFLMFYCKKEKKVGKTLPFKNTDIFAIGIDVFAQ